FDDQVGDERDVAQLDEVAGDRHVPVVVADLGADELDAAGGAFEAAVGADDADVVPHQAADLVPVVAHHHGVVGRGGVAGVPGGHLGGALAADAADVVGGAGAEDHRLEQRVRGQAAGAVQAGHRHVADGVEVLHRRATVLVDQNAAAAVVGGGHHRDR